MQKVPTLTPRLQQIADWITPCRCMADIGTDHGYLPVYLCAKGICDSAVASDIRSGPLRRAEDTIRQYGMTGRIIPRLGSGAETLIPGETEVIAIAGMGGLMIADILRAKPTVFQMAKQILLQPMSSIPELRLLLWELDYRITQEAIVPEGKKLYHILKVQPGREPAPPSHFEAWMGQYLIEQKPPHFDQYLAIQIRRLEQKCKGLTMAQTGDPSKELNRTKAMLEQALKLLR